MENLIDKVRELYETYKNDVTILNKLNNHINYELPNLLNNFKSTQIIKEERKNLLIEGQDSFTNFFLSKNNIYYHHTSEIFFLNENNNFLIIKEDDLIHKILTTLNYNSQHFNRTYYEKQLLPWKYKIKTSLIKKIKENSIINCIPNNETIENIINLFKNEFFSSYLEAKYFLVIIGDIIQKKNTNIFFICNLAKELLRNLDNNFSLYFSNCNLVNYFKFKFYDHSFNDARLININEKFNPKNINYDYIQLIKNNITNIFVVCNYLSIKEVESDIFLREINEPFKNYTLFLKNNNEEKIIDDFISNNIEYSEGLNLSWKNINYLWKLYRNEKKIPNILFLHQFKNIIQQKLNYDEKLDCLINYSSFNLPIVLNFQKFWDEIIFENEEEYFIEIEEIKLIFKSWLNQKKINLTYNEVNLLNIIKYYYPDIIIENEEQILGYSFKNFNKKEILLNYFNNNKDIENEINKIDIIYIKQEYTKYKDEIINKNKSNENKINKPIISFNYFKNLYEDFYKNN